MEKDITLNDYVHVPQNDKQQIEQVVREYETEGKGLAHGVQKDAIQNGFGARVIKDEIKACEKWKFYFELIKIKGHEALAFWDEETVGLTGEVLTMEEIERKSAEGLLGKEHSHQNLARFLTRFESGGNLGAGSFGRGKLIFQGASKTFSILIDSFRSDDDKYCALNRKIIGTSLKQHPIPFLDDAAKKFIRDESDGILKPLNAYGTRITILNVREEIIDAFKKSFTEEAEQNGYSEVFSRMIEETWWEIIEFGAKIILKLGKKEKQIILTEPLKTIIHVEDKDNGYRVYKKKNIDVVVDNETYKIKHLKFIVTPSPTEEELRQVWSQRKRMKIGSISKGIIPHHKIQKNLTGYVILDSKLEELFEQKESTTHYGYDFRGRKSAISQVRESIRTHLDLFQQQLGLRVQSSARRARQDMLDTLKELNEQANKLGLPTDFSVGPEKKEVEISIDSFELPNPSMPRVEIGDKVGPIVYIVTNYTNKLQRVKIEITGEQRDKIDKLKLTTHIDLRPDEKKTLPLSFQIDSPRFSNYEGLLVRARVFNQNSNEKMHQVSRMIWIGMDPPEKPDEWVSIINYLPLFPHLQSRRVELGESIRNIHIKIVNNASISLNVNLDLVVRKAKCLTSDVKELLKLVTHRNYNLPPLSEREFAVSEIQINEEIFGDIFQGIADTMERKCEIFFSVRSARNYPSIKVTTADHLGPKKSIPFFCGIDPPGMSVFKSLDEKEEPDDGKRSWVENRDGNVFVLNVGHSSYKLADELGEDFRKYYIREQMLFQGYLIAIKEKVFKGAAGVYEEIFSDDNIPVYDKIRYVDEIVGVALNQLS